MGPKPMQLVVVMAVRKAVSAATITFTATSIKRCFFMIADYSLIQLSLVDAFCKQGDKEFKESKTIVC